MKQILQKLLFSTELQHGDNLGTNAEPCGKNSTEVKE